MSRWTTDPEGIQGMVYVVQTCWCLLMATVQDLVPGPVYVRSLGLLPGLQAGPGFCLQCLLQAGLPLSSPACALLAQLSCAVENFLM